MQTGGPGAQSCIASLVDEQIPWAVPQLETMPGDAQPMSIMCIAAGQGSLIN